MSSSVLNNVSKNFSEVPGSTPKQKQPVRLVGQSSSESEDEDTNSVKMSSKRPSSDQQSAIRNATTLCPSDLATIRQSQFGKRKRLPIGRGKRGDLDQDAFAVSTFNFQKSSKKDPPQNDSKENYSDKTSWHHEELELMTGFEKYATHKSKIHGEIHHRFMKKNKWLRIILNIATAIAGTTGLAAALSSLVSNINWGPILTAIFTIIIGLISSIGDAFEWHKKAADHWIASDRYMHLAMEIRRLKIGHNLGRDYCTVSLLRVSERCAEIHNAAPWSDEPEV
jgi:hypothetical protein